MIWNKLWIIKSRGFKIKNKILPYDLVIFQTSWCYYLEFILNIKMFSMLILTDFKSESSGFLMFEGVRNGTLAKLDYQLYLFVVLSNFKLMFLSYTRWKYQKTSDFLLF